MLLNVVVPTGLSSPSASFNLDRITLLVMAIVALIGLIVFLLLRPERAVGTHLHGEAEPTGPSAPTGRAC